MTFFYRREGAFLLAYSDWIRKKLDFWNDGNFERSRKKFINQDKRSICSFLISLFDEKIVCSFQTVDERKEIARGNPGDILMINGFTNKTPTDNQKDFLHSKSDTGTILSSS